MGSSKASFRESRGAGLAPIAACVAAFFLVFACQVDGQAFLPENQLDAMDAAAFLTKFKAAAIAAGYQTLLGDSNFTGTVFAPVDQGFNYSDANLTVGATNVTQQLMNASEQLTRIVRFHIVPGVKLFPLTLLKAGVPIPTLDPGAPLYIDRSVPGLLHIYGVAKPEIDPLNFGTVLQYQEIKGGQSILYVIDKELVPPTGPAKKLRRRAL